MTETKNNRDAINALDTKLQNLQKDFWQKHGYDPRVGSKFIGVSNDLCSEILGMAAAAERQLDGVKEGEMIGLITGFVVAQLSTPMRVDAVGSVEIGPEATEKANKNIAMFEDAFNRGKEAFLLSQQFEIENREDITAFVELEKAQEKSFPSLPMDLGALLGMAGDMGLPETPEEKDADQEADANAEAYADESFEDDEEDDSDAIDRESGEEVDTGEGAPVEVGSEEGSPE